MAERDTIQIREWKGDFGKDYTDRNTLDPTELDALYRSNYGVSRTALNQSFLAQIPAEARILEVGCNVGNQLLLLHQSGYTNLHGIEIQSYAVERARKRVPGASIVEGSALNIPFPDQTFDLVFTSGVLIHIAPANLANVLDEVHRTSKTWIWGFEYYAAAATSVEYRGHESLLWKNAFAQLYLSQFPDLELVYEKRLPYLNNQNMDTMFLLRRKS
jgi:pseudaminic acid biosynthesis-associated methylase